jgi:hypothetical protein
LITIRQFAAQFEAEVGVSRQLAGLTGFAVLNAIVPSAETGGL